jgi:hypothetical protein
LQEKQNRLIIISDYGFYSFGKVRVQTLPQKRADGVLKGDHHEKAILITTYVNYEFNKPQDVFGAIQSASGH